MPKARPSSRYRTPTVEEVAQVLAGAPADTPWAREAPVRHRIRASLLRRPRLLGCQPLNWVG
jgi:hypothetical protein